ncbi:uncharacterized protein EI97DRAFT_430582 [Westerdykella ornata]|uniref:Glycosyl transferase CAP10 domain-containing protein n=1 Tax=Westerdykella ornata TaxID=318751 RepID=A0A6A6JWT6_WESOR|nr:uncharacterized protein EI97DRAFT_430582 [Westerdykella ornata]KAF2279529.1 hypothetical protein EI97DRAFT_430582 [Westerdykella ornata]
MAAPLVLARTVAARAFRLNPLLFSVLILSVFLFWSYRGPVQQQWHSMKLPQTSPHLTSHPVDVLVDHYKKKFERMLESQSSTLEEATAKYQERYHRPPPPGFDHWFEFAKKQNSTIIDDFDTIEESVQYLQSARPEQLRNAVRSAASAANAKACSWTTRDGRPNLMQCDWMGREVEKVLALVQDPLPDTELLLNSLDEPRVISPVGTSNDDQIPAWIDASRKSIWDRVTQICQDRKAEPSKNAGLNQKTGIGSLKFVTDVEDAKDLCKHPEYANMHGFFQAPTTFLFTDSVVPVLSNARPSTFRDILYPPPYYIGVKDMKPYNEAEDPDWELKRPQLYWAGSTTGSYASASSDTWRSSHRQRFVARVNQLSNESATFLTETSRGVWEPFTSQDVSPQLYDVKFTNVVQCEESQCIQINDYFHPSEKEERSTSFHYRFLFDLDGNSFSGRYYTLLESKSVVLKQTIFKEWHDDRLVPWVHYIPVSMDMGELPELMRYLALTERGSRISKDIANAGRDWLRKVLRKEDAAVYMYRLLLELGRLMNPPP